MVGKNGWAPQWRKKEPEGSKEDVPRTKWNSLKEEERKMLVLQTCRRGLQRIYYMDNTEIHDAKNRENHYWVMRLAMR